MGWLPHSFEAQKFTSFSSWNFLNYLGILHTFLSFPSPPPPISQFFCSIHFCFSTLSFTRTVSYFVDAVSISFFENNDNFNLLKCFLFFTLAFCCGLCHAKGFPWLCHLVFKSWLKRWWETQCMGGTADLWGLCLRQWFSTSCGFCSPAPQNTWRYGECWLSQLEDASGQSCYKHLPVYRGGPHSKGLSV